jgi:outer membrane protein, multidrug efflux system
MLSRVSSPDAARTFMVRGAAPIASALLLAILSSGCAVRAPYTAPATAPAALESADAEFFRTDSYDPRWWQQFDDPVLEQLEGIALQSNYNVKIAVARLQQARAIFRDVELDRFPTAGVGVSFDERERTIPGFTDKPIRTTTYQAGFDAFWEVDLFGGVRSAVRAAAAQAQAFEATLDDVRVTVAAEVARQYFELRGLQQQLAVAQRSIDNQGQTLRLTRVRSTEGFGEELDVASASARVSAIESTVPPLQAAILQHTHRLAVLTGARPGELAVDLSPRPYAPLAKALALGDPSLLLRRRPDVRAAERRLAAATGRERVAAADLLPRISISGFLGLLAGRGNVFGTADSRAWAVTPALSWVGLDLGSARARLRGARAATQEAAAQYEQTVLEALEETENALIGYREQQRRLIALADQARESTRAASIARVRYREGVSDFLDLLDAERTQLQAEDSVAQAESGVFTSVVAVYKALGGIAIQ